MNGFIQLTLLMLVLPTVVLSQEMQFDKNWRPVDLQEINRTHQVADWQDSELMLAAEYPLDWSQTAGGKDSDYGSCATTDSDGNIIIAGVFRDKAELFGQQFISFGESDIFIAKFDQAGMLNWVQQAGGSNFDVIRGITCDGQGNILITGEYWHDAVFGDTTLVGLYDGDVNVFLVKYDSDGYLQWAWDAGDSGVKVGFGVSTDHKDNITLTGIYMSRIDLGDTTLVSSATFNGFVISLNQFGDLRWAREIKSQRLSQNRAVSVNISGDVIVAGNYINRVILQDTTLTGDDNDEVFIAKYDSQGNFLWARAAQGLGEDFGEYLNSDTHGNSLLVGSFSENLIFANNELFSLGGDDIFLSKYDPAGILVWTQQFGGPGSDKALGISLNQAEDFLLSGFFQSSAIFGDKALKSAGGNDIFLASIDGSSGHVTQRLRAGGPGDDEGRGVATDALNNVYQTGAYSHGAVIGTDTLSSQGDKDIFIVKSTSDFATGIVDQNTVIPQGFQLAQNYPNPFNPNTQISFTLAFPADISLIIYNALGQKVRTLIKQSLNLGVHQVDWDGRDDLGQLIASGVYVYQLQSQDFKATRKMLLLK